MFYRVVSTRRWKLLRQYQPLFGASPPRFTSHRKYQDFLVKCGKAEKKEDPEKVATFLAHVAESAGGLGGVNMARSALSQLFKLEGFSEDKNPALSPQVNLVIKGIHRRFTTPTEKKEAISLAQLEKVVRAAS